MITAAIRLETILNSVPPKLLSFTDEEAARRPAPGKWSKKEIIGHLIDSASNNHQHFVRLQLANNISLPNYEQDNWVSVQRYQELNWIDLVKVWRIYNKHLLHMMTYVDGSNLQNMGTINNKSMTLQFFLDDYADHLEYHLKVLMA